MAPDRGSCVMPWWLVESASSSSCGGRMGGRAGGLQAGLQR